MSKIIEDHLELIEDTSSIFKEYLESIPYGSYRETLDLIRERCCVSKQAVYYWRTGKTKIKPVYMRVINDIAGREVFKYEWE